MLGFMEDRFNVGAPLLLVQNMEAWESDGITWTMMHHKSVILANETYNEQHQAPRAFYACPPVLLTLALCKEEYPAIISEDIGFQFLTQRAIPLKLLCTLRLDPYRHFEYITVNISCNFVEEPLSYSWTPLHKANTLCHEFGLQLPVGASFSSNKPIEIGTACVLWGERRAPLVGSDLSTSSWCESNLTAAIQASWKNSTPLIADNHNFL